MSAETEIVITGVSSELGRVLTLALAATENVRILGTQRRGPSDADGWPDNVTVLDGCDLLDRRECERLGDRADAMFSGPFGLIHSVGDFWEHVPLNECPPDEAARLFRSHVETLYNVVYCLTPVMRAKGGGSCIALSCNSVKHNYPWMAAFTAAKSAVESLVRSFANELAECKIRFNALELASLQTEKVRRSKPHGDFARFVPPADLEALVRFLLSDAAYLVSGSALNVFRHSDTFYHSGYFERVAR